jgi:hypothetical protein
MTSVAMHFAVDPNIDAKLVHCCNVHHTNYDDVVTCRSKNGNEGQVRPVKAAGRCKGSSDGIVNLYTRLPANHNRIVRWPAGVIATTIPA